MLNDGSLRSGEGESELTLAIPQEGNPNFDDINGNWDEVRQQLDEQAARGGMDPVTDSETLYRLIAANSLAAQVALFGGPVQIPDSEVNRGPSSAPVRGGTVARAFWWGFHIQISHEDVQVIVSAIDGATIVVDALSVGDVAPKAIRPFLPLVRLFLNVSRAVIQALDRGNGVYISMSWFAPGVFVPTSVP